MERVQKKIDTVLIGCGKIAGHDDTMDLRSKYSSYSYSETISFFPEIQISGLVDLDLKKAKKIAKKYSINRVFRNFNEAIYELKPRLVIISSSSSSHFEICKGILNIEDSKTELIIIEKPICENLNELNELISLSKTRKTSVIVNHSRRFNPKFKILKEQIKNNKFGKLIKVDIDYYGGIFNNGVHVIDTLVYLLNDSIRVNDIKFKKIKHELERHSQNDLYIYFQNKFLVRFSSFEQDYYQLFDIDLKFENCRLSIKDFGKKIQIENKTTNYLGENVLIDNQKKLSKLKNISNMYYLIETVVNYFYQGKKINDYLIDNSLSTMKILFKINDYENNY